MVILYLLENTCPKYILRLMLVEEVTSKTEIISPKSEGTFKQDSNSSWLVPRFGLHYLRLNQVSQIQDLEYRNSIITVLN